MATNAYLSLLPDNEDMKKTLFFCFKFLGPKPKKFLKSECSGWLPAKNYVGGKLLELKQWVGLFAHWKNSVESTCEINAELKLSFTVLRPKADIRS